MFAESHWHAVTWSLAVTKEGLAWGPLRLLAGHGRRLMLSWLSRCVTVLSLMLVPFKLPGTIDQLVGETEPRYLWLFFFNLKFEHSWNLP